MIPALLLALAQAPVAAQGYPPPPGLLLGVDATTADAGEPGGGWPAGRLLRLDEATGEAWHIDAGAFPTGHSLAPAAVRTQVYILSGEALIGRDRLVAGDMLNAEAGTRLGRLQFAPGTRLLLFREPKGAFPINAKRTVVRGASVEWRAGTVARDAGAPAPLEIKPLWTDATSGAQFHLVRVAPGVGVPWEVHPTAEEGYLVDGDYHLAECLPDGRRDFDYREGGYFYRPAGLIHSGPESYTRRGGTWLIRTPAKLSAVFYPACPAPLAKEDTP